LCDTKAGDTVSVAGLVGKTMLLPEDSTTNDIIMVATGTGVAPFVPFCTVSLWNKRWRVIYFSAMPG
jgi:sulfite reductase alpha subunit-like flavoprotein